MRMRISAKQAIFWIYAGGLLFAVILAPEEWWPFDTSGYISKGKLFVWVLFLLGGVGLGLWAYTKGKKGW